MEPRGPVHFECQLLAIPHAERRRMLASRRTRRASGAGVGTRYSIGGGYVVESPVRLVLRKRRRKFTKGRRRTSVFGRAT